MAGIWLAKEEILSLSEYWLNQEFSKLLFTDISEDSLYEEDNEIIDLAIDTSRDNSELFVSIEELLPSNCGIFVQKLKLNNSEHDEDGGWLAPPTSLNGQKCLK
jgi:hypothetical protein